MSNKETIVRVYIVYFTVLLLAAGVVCQIFFLQFFEGAQLKQDADKQIFVSKKINAPRGNIYASNQQKTSLALSVPRYKAYVDLITIKDGLFRDSITSLCDSLTVLLPYRSSMDWEELLVAQRLKGNRYFFIARGLRNDQIDRIRSFPIFNMGKYNI